MISPVPFISGLEIAVMAGKKVTRIVQGTALQPRWQPAYGLSECTERSGGDGQKHRQFHRG